MKTRFSVFGFRFSVKRITGNKIGIAQIIGIAVLAGLLTATASFAETPTAYVKSLMDKVLAIQNNPALAGEAHKAERARAIREIIRQSFDFDRMAQISLGPAYGRVGAGARREFVDTFTFLFQDSYTRMVLNYLKQETVKYHQEQITANDAKVKTSLIRANETIPVDYLMRRAGQAWLLYDVIVDGVSILENYKTQFAQVIRSHSFEYLLNRMKTQRKAIQ
jgi:phospholipid transport system substrate-binding protein